LVVGFLAETRAVVRLVVGFLAETRPTVRFVVGLLAGTRVDFVCLIEVRFVFPLAFKGSAQTELESVAAIEIQSPFTNCPRILYSDSNNCT